MPLDLETGMNFNHERPSDQGVFAQFYLNPVQNNAMSEREGRPIFEDKVFIKIRTPGDRLTEVDRPVKEEDKHRFPMQWARFQQTGDTSGVPGTPLKEWPAMTPAVVAGLNAVHIFTVEQMAGVQDGQLQNLGPGARDWREKAKLYLERAKEGAAGAAMAADMQKMREENEALKAQLADLAAAVRRKEAEDARTA